MIKFIDIVKDKKYFSTKVEGNSMFPLFHTNDILFFKKTTFNTIKTNDVLMIKKGKELITHRVIYRTGEYLITKGDNNLIADGKIYPKQIIGKVYRTKRNGQIFNLENIYLFQSTLYFQEILKIKKAFEKEKVDFVFLKGLPLHLYFEKKHPNRFYLDCDLLVAKKDLILSETILLKLKYKKIDTYWTKTQKHLQNKDTQFTYSKKVNDFVIVFDIHAEVSLSIVHLGRLDALYPQVMLDQLTNKLIREKKIVNIYGEKFPILSLDNLCIYLAIHFFHHNFKGAFRLELLDKVIRQGVKKDPELLFKCAGIIKTYRLQNYLYLVFLLLKKYYKTPLTNQFLNEIRPQSDKLPYIQYLFSHDSIFDDELRMQAAVNRFKNLFYLSPVPLIRKLLVFTNPQVIYSILWIFYRKSIKIIYIRKKTSYADII
jgi:signal peptidase I